MIKVGDTFTDKSGKFEMKVTTLYADKIVFIILKHPIEKYIGYKSTLKERIILENFKKGVKYLFPDE